jgi:hypothetical protein
MKNQKYPQKFSLSSQKWLEIIKETFSNQYSKANVWVGRQQSIFVPVHEVEVIDDW